MSETIPDDVMKTARAIGEAWFGAGHHDSAALADEVARAIMAERERAARIAENAPMEAWATHVDIARREAYKAGVAAAIRNA